MPSLTGLGSFHFSFPALTCRAFLYRRFAAGALARSILSLCFGLQHLLFSTVQPGGTPGSPLARSDSPCLRVSVQITIPFVRKALRVGVKRGIGRGFIRGAPSDQKLRKSRFFPVR
jgi:hypothetical protein